MAGSAAAVFLSSVIALLCLYHLLLPVPDPAAGPVGALRRAHRRAGRHQHHHVSSLESSNTTPLGSSSGEHPGLPDIETFRDALDRLPADWSGFDAELGPLGRYFGPAAPLGVRERLVYLFAILDRSPRDGGVSLAELEAWLRRHAAARLEAATRREMAKHDRNGDGAVALSEYRGMKPGKPWGWLHKFATADGDGDGSLNAAELNDFLHPEDSSHETMQLWLLKDKLSEMDHDGDRRLSLEEFVHLSHALDHISIAHHLGDHGLARAQAEKKFQDLDADMDNYLTVEEARPVIQSLLTGEFSYATSQAKLLMKADSDGDGKLSLDEMLNDYTSFYNIVYMDDHYDSEEVDGDYRDEL
ncbi:calumenin-A [Setaria italica]|uniref:calumenin-A n=1 Tax=Setaria italica TaxID=4555 RepID=UPI000350BC9E|nr:calumenin-A [Setaria italica]